MEEAVSKGQPLVFTVFKQPILDWLCRGGKFYDFG
jgi:hypothetical protein